jgi:sulfide:quinone oxidoreductase
VFGLGDASNLPTSKTAAAVSSQAAVATANLLATIRDPNAALPESYTGYTSCPLVTGYGKLVLAEFDYSLQPCETVRLHFTRSACRMVCVCVCVWR